MFNVTMILKALQVVAQIIAVAFLYHHCRQWPTTLAKKYWTGWCTIFPYFRECDVYKNVFYDHSNL